MNGINSAFSRNKIFLVENLRELENINVKIELEKNPKKKQKLKYVQQNRVKQVSNLIPYLNSVGKLSDKEVKSLLSLDLYKIKNLRINFRIGD